MSAPNSSARQKLHTGNPFSKIVCATHRVLAHRKWRSENRIRSVARLVGKSANTPPPVSTTRAYAHSCCLLPGGWSTTRPPSFQRRRWVRGTGISGPTTSSKSPPNWQLDANSTSLFLLADRMQSNSFCTRPWSSPTGNCQTNHSSRSEVLMRLPYGRSNRNIPDEHPGVPFRSVQVSLSPLPHSQPLIGFVHDSLLSTN